MMIWACDRCKKTVEPMRPHDTEKRLLKIIITICEEDITTETLDICTDCYKTFLQWRENMPANI